MESRRQVLLTWNLRSTAVRKSNGSHHSVWGASGNMGCDLRRCTFSTLFSLFGWLEILNLRKQSTFHDATTGSPAKWHLRNEHRNSVLMTYHYPDPGSASDWSCRVGNLLQPIRSSTQIWVVTRHQYGISALVSQTSWNVSWFSQARRYFEPGHSPTTLSFIVLCQCTRFPPCWFV